MFQTFSVTDVCSSKADALFGETRNARSHMQWVTSPTRSDCSEASSSEGGH